MSSDNAKINLDNGITAPDNLTIKTALVKLTQAVARLEDAVGRRIENQKQINQSGEEFQLMLVDRVRLAGELDQSESRADKLEDANREVSRRLVASMETIRAVLDRDN